MKRTSSMNLLHIKNIRVRNNNWFPREVQKRWDKGIKIDVSDFEGHLKLKEFLDWVDRVHQFFEWKGVSHDKKVKFVSLKTQRTCPSLVETNTKQSWDRMKGEL